MIQNCSDEVIERILPTIYEKSKFSQVSRQFNRIFCKECASYYEHLRQLRESCQEIEPEYNSDFEPLLSDEENDYEYGDCNHTDDY